MSVQNYSRRKLVSAATFSALSSAFTGPAWAAPGGNGKGKPALGGAWSQVYSWPDVAIHLHLLPSGKILSFSDDDHDGSRDADFSKAFVIDVPTGGAPASTYVNVNNTTTNMFCSGHAFLPD